MTGREAMVDLERQRYYSFPPREWLASLASPLMRSLDPYGNFPNARRDSAPSYVVDAAIRLQDLSKTDDLYRAISNIMLEAFTAGRDLRGKVAVCSKGRPGLITGAKLMPWGPSWVGVGLDDGHGPTITRVRVAWASRSPFVIADSLDDWLGRYCCGGRYCSTGVREIRVRDDDDGYGAAAGVLL